MVIVLGFMHVKGTTTTTFKKELSVVLSRHNIDVFNIRNQGYDDASNIKEEWNGLHALFLNDNY